MRKIVGLVAVAAAVVLTAAGCADADTQAASVSVSKSPIAVTMVDNRFEPAQVTVKKGTPVTFRFANDGKLTHEALIANSAMQDEHAKQMASGESGAMGDMNHGGDMGDMGGMSHEGTASAVTVQPGKSATLTTTFEATGTMLIGCHQPGHYEAGMKATIHVID